MNTHTFKLCSGVTCVITELTGKHFRILTQKTKGETQATRLNRMLADLIIKVGNTPVSAKSPEGKLDFVGELLANDRKHILVEARQFSMDFEPNFSFTYTYEFESEEVEATMELNLEEGQGEKGKFPVKPTQKQFTDMYSNEDKTIEVILPRSKKKIRYRMLDGNGESIGAATKDPDSSLPFKMRRTEYFNENAGKGGVWIGLNPDNLGMKDFGFLLNSFKSNEGSVDTEMKILHPKAEELGLEGENKYLIVDLLNLDSFFFPSV